MRFLLITLEVILIWSSLSCGLLPTKYDTVYQSAAEGDLEDIHRHIARGHPLDVRGDSGGTALHIAAFRNDTAMIGLLLRAGINPHIRDDFDRGPLSWAALGHATQAAGYLLRLGYEIPKGSKAYQIAVARNDAAFVDTLLKYGADPNEDFGVRGNPIEWAVINDAVDVLKLLLDKGVDVHHECGGGSTLLHLAAQAYTRPQSHARMIHSLLDMGMDPNSKDSLGRTPLHVAILNGYPETVKVLMEHGAKPDAKAVDGMTPLDLAKRRAELEGETRYLDALTQNWPKS